MAEQIMPHNQETEQSVLGSMIIEKKALEVVMNQLIETDFYLERHRLIFSAAHSLFSVAQGVDIITLVSELRRRQHLEQAGGLTYLNNLVEIVPTTANIETYVKELQDKAILRAIILSSHKITNLAYQAEEAPVDVLNKADQEFFNIANRRGLGSTYSSLGTILHDTYDEIGERRAQAGGYTGVATGFVDLDHITSGFQKSDLIIIAARPGMGKTALMTNMIASASLKYGIPAAFFSLEMSKIQLAQRILSQEADVKLTNIRTGQMSDYEWNQLTDQIGILAAAPIYIDDTPALSIAEFRSRLRQMKNELNIGIVVVDYLQLMTMDTRSESRQQEISFLSRALKAIAKELDMPVLVASQLNRGVESRHDKRPILSDLLESGGIEANADMVLFLYRDLYYDKESENKFSELIIAKNRNGPTQTVKLAFRGEFTQFGNWLDIERN